MDKVFFPSLDYVEKWLKDRISNNDNLSDIFRTNIRIDRKLGQHLNIT